MKILVPSIIDPQSFRGGARAATLGLLRVLKSEPLLAEIDLLTANIKSGSMAHRVRRFASIVHSMFSTLPSKAIFHRTREFRTRLLRVLSEKDYDVVLINGSDLIWVLDLVESRIPTVVLAHNLEYVRDGKGVTIEGLPEYQELSDLGVGAFLSE